MARVCEISGRKTTTGKNREHKRGKAGGTKGPWSKKAPATKKIWRPNLRKVKLNIDGSVQTAKISMKIYKKLRKVGKLSKAKITLAK